jgi:hypothetical protein
VQVFIGNVESVGAVGLTERAHHFLAIILIVFPSIYRFAIKRTPAIKIKVEKMNDKAIFLTIFI